MPQALDFPNHLRQIEYHVGDCQYHFVRERIEDGFIKIVFVRSCENDGDIFTKNVNKDIYDKHVSLTYFLELQFKCEEVF